MRKNIERIGERIATLKAFDPLSMRDTHPPELAALQISIASTLERAFGADTADYRNFSNAAVLQWEAGFAVGDYPQLSHYQQGIRENISHSIAILGEAIRVLEEEIADAPESAAEGVREVIPKRDLSKVFIVHGHDEAVKQGVARFIEKLGFEAIILHERPNKGRTIITKFREESANAGFAVVLMTPDDVGKARDAIELKPRARQNVVFELAFFIGVLGSKCVAALVKGNIEKPSDFDGVVYLSLDAGDWKTKLAQDLEEAGDTIDWRKAAQG